jgi:urease accessory protein
MVQFEKLAEKANSAETIEVKAKREDARRGRLRTRTSDGEDLIIDLPRGAAINDKDVFGPSGKGRYYRISIEPEPVVKVSLKESVAEKDLENALRLGYSLGNHHLEVLVEGDAAYVPVTIAEEKIREILRRSGLPLQVETQQRVISAAASGYYAGEEEEHV